MTRREVTAEWLEQVRVTTSSTSVCVQLALEDLSAAYDSVTALRSKRPDAIRALRALSSITLVLIAFESWVNQVYVTMRMFTNRADAARRERLLLFLNHKSLADRVRCIPRYAGGQRLSKAVTPDLDDLEWLRHECMHPISNTIARTAPDRLEAFQRRGLLVDHFADPSAPQSGMWFEPHEDRMSSYPLARWVWKTIDDTGWCVMDAVAAIEDPEPLGLLHHPFGGHSRDEFIWQTWGPPLEDQTGLR